MTARHTIASPTTTLSGTGLHTGSETSLTFLPGETGSGIVFQRMDLADQPRIPVRLDRVTDADHRTVLTDGDARVETVEHVLAAVFAHQIDDLVIQLTGPEPPAADGSAAAFVDALRGAGVAENGGSSVLRSITNPLVVRNGDATYLVAPHEGLRVTVMIEWDHPRISRQSGCFDITPDAFTRHLARARTFGFRRDAAELQSRGLARGTTSSNTIVLSETDVVDTQLRWPDEFVRHKAVDLLGDLALLGGQVRGDIVAFRPSHRGNVALARALERTGNSSAPPVMGIEEILGIIPHRYPMLLVDRIVEIEARKRIVGIKNVTINEPFFQGHFPGHPIMPGVLIVEAMAQVGGMLLLGTVDDPEGKVVYFMSIDGVKFRRPVVPGDQIRFELEMLQFRGKTCRMSGIGYVDGQAVAEAEMMARIVDR